MTLAVMTTRITGESAMTEPMETTPEQLSNYRAGHSQFAPPLTRGECQERMQTAANAYRNVAHQLEAGMDTGSAARNRRKLEATIIMREQTALRMWMKDHKEHSESQSLSMGQKPRKLIGACITQAAELVRLIQASDPPASPRVRAQASHLRKLLVELGETRRGQGDDGQ